MKKTKTEDTANGPEMMDYSQYGSTGFESVNTDDLGIPFLSIIQSGSPEFKESHPEHETYKIEGAKVGAIFQSLSRELLWVPKVSTLPLVFVPCYFQKLFVEWTPRERGGGIVRTHSNPAILTECTRNDRNQDVLKNGNLVVTTAYFFGKYQVSSDEEEWANGIISMTSTQLKKARLWLNMMSALKVDSPKGKITPPMFSHQYLITTIPEQNEKGDWSGWKIEQGGRVQTKETVQALAEFSANIRQTQSRLLLNNHSGDDAIPV